MAKLDQLKSLLDARRAAAKPVPVAPAGPVRAVAAKPTGAQPPQEKDARSPLRRAPSPKRAVASAKHAGGDIDLATAFSDVQRLPPVNRARIVRQRPVPVAAQRLADEQDALLASKYGDVPAPHSWDVGQEPEGEQTFVRPGIGSDVLTKLRRGHWSLQGEVDLHGMTVPEAHDVLTDFLLGARGRGARCVRVVHGKGLTSPNKEPVLKGRVRKWLAHWDDVLAYCEAPRHAGGGGAVLILLRGNR
jgi:DNA-nicking Smr family endonuclease